MPNRTASAKFRTGFVTAGGLLRTTTTDEIIEAAGIAKVPCTFLLTRGQTDKQQAAQAHMQIRFAIAPSLCSITNQLATASGSGIPSCGRAASFDAHSIQGFTCV